MARVVGAHATIPACSLPVPLDATWVVGRQAWVVGRQAPHLRCTPDTTDPIPRLTKLGGPRPSPSPPIPLSIPLVAWLSIPLVAWQLDSHHSSCARRVLVTCSSRPPTTGCLCIGSVPWHVARARRVTRAGGVGRDFPRDPPRDAPPSKWVWAGVRARRRRPPLPLRAWREEAHEGGRGLVEAGLAHLLPREEGLDRLDSSLARPTLRLPLRPILKDVPARMHFEHRRMHSRADDSGQEHTPHAGGTQLGAQSDARPDE